MAKKKTLTDTAVQNAVEAITEIAGADGKNGKKKEPAEIVAEKLAETVAPIAGVEPEKPKSTKKKASDTAAKKPAAKKAAAKKPASKKTAAKKDTSKAAESKSALSKSALPIEYQCKGGKYTGEEIIEKCKAAYKNGSRKTVHSIEVYVKGSKAYFTVNGKSEDENGKAYFVEL